MKSPSLLSTKKTNNNNNNNNNNKEEEEEKSKSSFPAWTALKSATAYKPIYIANQVLRIITIHHHTTYTQVHHTC